MKQKRAAKNDHAPETRGGVPPGVPGAGWLVAAFFVFAVVIFTGWSQGWWEHNYTTAAGPAQHRTTGAGNRPAQ